MAVSIIDPLPPLLNYLPLVENEHHLVENEHHLVGITSPLRTGRDRSEVVCSRTFYHPVGVNPTEGTGGHRSDLVGTGPCNMLGGRSKVRYPVLG